MTEPTTVSRSRAAIRQAWIERLARFANAGQSAAQFCAAEGVSVASLYHWKRRLAASASVPVAPTDAPRLLPVRLAGTPTPLEVLLPGGAVLRVGPGADPDTLAALLRLLGVPAC
jgi:transposase